MKLTIQTKAQDGSTDASRTLTAEFTRDEYLDPDLRSLLLGILNAKNQLDLRVPPPPKADK